MKKLLTVSLAIIVLSGLILAGCGESEPPQPSTSTATVTSTSTTTSMTTTTKTSTTTTTTSAKPIELKFSYHTPPQASLVGIFFQAWTDSITEATNGRVQITHYPSATLVSLTDQYDAVVSGLADIAMVEPDITPGRFPLSEFNLLPFTFPNGEIGARVNYEILEKYCFDTEWKDVKVLMTPALPPMNFFGTKEVKVLEDMNGLKIRSGGRVESWINEALRATPVEFETSELSTSLERGLVQGAWLTYSAVLAFGVKDVTQYRTIVGLFPRAWVIVMNLDTWNSLPDDIKQAIEEQSGALKSAQYCAANDKALEGAKGAILGSDKGAGNPPFYTLPADEKARWKEAVLPVWDRWIDEVESKGLPGRELLDDALALIDKYSQ